MNKSQDELNKLRAAHSEKWQQLADAGFKPQRIAAIIEAHAAETEQRLRDNPPEKQAQAQAAAAAAIVRTHLERASLAKGEYDKLVSELRAQFPDLQIEIIEEAPGTTPDAQAEIERFKAQIKALEEALETAGKDAANVAEERDALRTANDELNKLNGELNEEITRLKNEAAGADAKISELDTERDALLKKIENAQAAKSLKAAHEALT